MSEKTEPTAHASELSAKLEQAHKCLDAAFELAEYGRESTVYHSPVYNSILRLRAHASEQGAWRVIDRNILYHGDTFVALTLEAPKS